MQPTTGATEGQGVTLIYGLLRDLAEAGAAIMMYTSELKEIQLVCDRAIVIFGGRVVAVVDGADADEPALLRAAYNLKQDVPMPEEVAAEVVAAESGAADAAAAEDQAMPIATATSAAITETTDR